VSTYTLGPDDGTLSVHTGRAGTVAKAGHDLLIVVTAWSATLDLGDEPSLAVDADSTSLRVREGTGGMMALDDGDKANIAKTIDDEVLLRRDISFRSVSIEPEGDGLRVTGELTLAGRTQPLTFELAVAGGRVTGSALVRQTEWGMKPFSALFGALKVADEVRVEVDAALPG
jgi:hypothetical protein